MVKDFSPAELAEMRADLERNPDQQGEAVAPEEATCPTVKLSAVALSHLEELDNAIDYMRCVALLDEEDMDVLGQYLAVLDAFTRGLEYAEKHTRMEVQ